MDDRFENFTRAEKEILFESLIYCLRSNSGIGFKGYDQGHPVYALGAETGTNVGMEDADDESASVMFQLLRSLSLHMVDSDSVTGLRKYFITDWKRFCEIATSANERHESRHVLPPLYDDDFDYR